MSESREFKIDALKERIGIFLQTEEGDGYGWPVVDEVDFDDLHDIIEALIDLKYQRDGDGDSVISFALGNRKTDRLIHTLVPNMPSRDDFEDSSPYLAAMKKFYVDSLAAAHSLIGMGSDVLRVTQFIMNDELQGRGKR